MTGTAFMSTQNWVFLAMFWGKNFFWATILEKPLFEVKLYAEAYQWWHFDKNNLLQNGFLKKIGIKPKNTNIPKIHNSLIF